MLANLRGDELSVALKWQLFLEEIYLFLLYSISASLVGRKSEKFLYRGDAKSGIMSQVAFILAF